MIFLALLTLAVTGLALISGSIPGFLWPIRYAGLAILPGAAFLLAIRKRRTGWMEFFVLVTCLSPVISGISILVLSLPGLAMRSAADITIIGFSLLLLFLLLRHRFEFIKADHEQRVMLLVSLVLTSLVSALILSNGYLRVRDDAWFHTAVVNEILSRGIPPQDPFFYGIKLLYFWFYHVYLAGLQVPGGPDPFSVMALLNVHFFLVIALTAFLFSKTFVSGISRYVWSLILLFFGMNPLGAPYLLLKSFVGETRGVGELTASIFGGASRALSALSPRYLHVSLGFGLDKFLVGTAFSIGMVLALVFLWKTCEYMRNGQKGDLFISSFLLLGAVLFHTVAGLTTFFVTEGALVFLLVFTKTGRERVMRGRLLVLLATFVLPVLASSPYLFSVMAGKSGGQVGGLNLNGGFLWSTAVSGLMFWIAAPKAFRYLAGVGAAGSFMAVWMIGLVVFGFIVPLPFGNESKFTNLLFVPLSITAGWFFPELLKGRRAARMVLYGLIFCLAGTNAIALVAFQADKGGSRGGRASFPSYERSAYQWISRYTSRDALVLDGEGRSELVVTGPRRLLWGGDSYAVGWGYEPSEMKRRKDLITELFGQAELSPDMLGLLRTFDTPVYVIWRKDDVGEALWEKPEGMQNLFRKVFEVPSIRIYEVRL